MKQSQTEISADPKAEAERLIGAVTGRGFKLRALGGVALAFRVPNFKRHISNLDFIVAPKQGSRVAIIIRNLGYEPHIAFNALHGDERLLFFDDTHNRQLDLFVGDFRMSHTLPFSPRFESEPLTVPLAELTLTKLQAVHFADKDVSDLLALLESHPVEDTDGEAINVHIIALACASDWGLWRTVTTNLNRCKSQANSEIVHSRIDALLAEIESEPKSGKWRLRSLVGEHKRWYEIPEEPTVKI